MRHPIWGILLVGGVVGFGLIGYVHVHLAEGKRFRDQPPERKRAIVCLAFAQWPYMVAAAFGLMGVIGYI
jgi:hypothetical protein